MSFGKKKRSRSERLFAHIAVHGLTTRAIAARLFCDNEETKTKNLFDPLLARKDIHAFRWKASSGLKFYTLSPRLAEELGVPGIRGRLTGKAINTSIAVLCFCHAMETPRAKVGPKAIKAVFGFEPPWKSAVFVLQTAPVHYGARVIVPGPATKPDYALKLISKESQLLLELPSMRGYVKAGRFRFVVLVQSEARRKLFSEQETLDRQLKRIPSDVHVDVVVVPDPSTLKISS